uniref:Uncharacterized protein n=1 Tax=uncultured haloarchaeon TaxID=160804 RepID=A0A0K1YB21_9EURY|nr:hypothetical protein [uncultured haloarchaeon]
MSIKTTDAEDSVSSQHRQLRLLTEESCHPTAHPVNIEWSLTGVLQVPVLIKGRGKGGN